MVFSNTGTEKNGLLQDCEQLIFNSYATITGNTELLADFTNRINRSYDKLATIIMSVDNRWQWDDRNYTSTLPIAETDIVNGQRDYTIDVEHLRILKVQVKDSAGNLITARPIDIHDPEGRAMYDQAPTAVQGIPMMYDKFADVIRLYPEPNYDATDGLVVHFQRPPSYFETTDTTKTAGVPSLFHRYLSLEASTDYAVSHQLKNKNDLFQMTQAMEKEIKDWYNQRSKDEQLTLRAKIRHSR
jgi:hypothetical protein